MDTFKFFISPLVNNPENNTPDQNKLPDDVLQAAGNRLKRYFDGICAAMQPRVFSGSAFGLSPHFNQVGDADLLVYITFGSLIMGMYDKYYEPDQAPHTRQSRGNPGGGTKKMPDGTVLSEVYWTGGLMGLRTSALKGQALANLIFHEFGHNKHLADPTALQYGEDPGGSYVHDKCGGGIFGADLSHIMASKLDPKPGNTAAMARVLALKNPQFRFGLFMDECGF